MLKFFKFCLQFALRCFGLAPRRVGFGRASRSFGFGRVSCCFGFGRGRFFGFSDLVFLSSKLSSAH